MEGSSRQAPTPENLLFELSSGTHGFRFLLPGACPPLPSPCPSQPHGSPASAGVPPAVPRCAVGAGLEAQATRQVPGSSHVRCEQNTSAKRLQIECRRKCVYGAFGTLRGLDKY